MAQYLGIGRGHDNNLEVKALYITEETVMIPHHHIKGGMISCIDEKISTT